MTFPESPDGALLVPEHCHTSHIPALGALELLAIQLEMNQVRMPAVGQMKEWNKGGIVSSLIIKITISSNLIGP